MDEQEADLQEQEVRDAELEGEEEAPRAGLFQFGSARPVHGSRESSRERSRSRSFSPMPMPRSAAEELEMLRRRVGGSSSDSEFEPGDVSDASVNSLGRRMETAFEVPEPKKRKRSTAAKPKRKAAKRARVQNAADEGAALRNELDDMYEAKDMGAAPAGIIPGAVGDDDEPEPIPADVVDWEEIDRDEPERNSDPNWCALCKHTQRVIDVGENNPYIPDIVKHAEDNWVHVEHVELMRQLQDKYNETVRWSIEQVDQRLPWHKKTIFAHFTRHTKGTRIKYEAESQAVDEMVFVMMQEELFVRNKKTGRKNVNLKKLPQFFKLLAQQERFEKTLKAMRPHNVL
jgi:hypothetical protein